VANNRDLERRVETRKLRVAAGATLLNIFFIKKMNPLFSWGMRKKGKQEKERMMWDRESVLLLVFRKRKFLGLPDPLVRCTDADADPDPFLFWYSN
jgi:hypothetical protein